MILESKEEYEKRLFLETIKTGKTPPRRGLGDRLMKLAGFPQSELKYHSSNHKKIEDIKIKDKNNKNIDDNISHYRLLQFNRFLSRYPYIQRSDYDLLKSPYFKSLEETIQKYLGDFFFTSNSLFVKFYYKKDADWYDLDFDYVQKFGYKKSGVRILPKN